MRTVELEVMEFTELSDTAKEKARDWYRQGSEFPFFDEYLSSIRAFCDEFGVSLKDWSIGDGRNTYLKTDAQPHNFRGYKLKDAEILSKKQLTGFCGDEITDYFYHEFKQSGDAFYSFQQALEHMLITIRNDVESYYSDESIDEMLEVNGYEFYPNGKIYH